MDQPTRRAVISQGIAASGALFAPPLFAATPAYCDFDEFHPDPTGQTPCDDAFGRWIRASTARGQIARAGAGLFRLATTRNIPLLAQQIHIQGAGAGKTIFRRAAGSVMGNGDCLIRFTGRGRGAVVTMRGLTVDMDCTQQPGPPGPEPLPDNFAWQHSIAVEFLPKTPHAFARIHIADCEVRDPISDGFSIRGGPAPGADVAIFERVANPTWPIDKKRPRVRGDITVTAFVGHLTVTDCVLPRLHYEVEEAMPDGFTMIVDEAGNRVGEMLAHFAGNHAFPERAVRTVRGGLVARSVFQGNCTTQMTGTRFALRAPSRLTGGPHRFEQCRFLIADGFPAGQSAAIGSSFPAASSITVIGGTLDLSPGAPPPLALFDRNGKRDGPGKILIDGLKNSTGINPATGKDTQITEQ